jgi:hypothetical protein
MNSEQKTIRPYFIPEEIDFAGLPGDVQLALTTQIEPLYQELVVGARSALAASVGTSFVFQTCIEVLEQLELVRAEFSSFDTGGSDPSERQCRREPYYRLQAAKSKSISALLRIVEIRMSKANDPLVRPPV